MREKKSRKGLIPVLCTVVLILLAATTFSCGCVNKMLSKSTDDPGQVADSSPQSATGMGGPAALPDATTGSVYQVPIAEITPVKSEVVTEVAPVLTPDPYPILHGIRINNTPQYNRLDRGVEYEKTFHLSGNATGLLVNVVEGPLYIIYEVTPKFDCMANPGSCRGNMKSPVTRPYMTITVRDNQTREIVAEDGYAREFSSDTGKYKFIIVGSGSGDSGEGEGEGGSGGGSGSSTSQEPGPRYIPIYKEGVFHITLEGNYLDVTVKILTGALPSKLDIETGTGSTPPPSEIPPEEEEWG